MYQVRIKKTNTSEPLLICRKVKDDIKTRKTSSPRISVAETCLLAKRCPAWRWRQLNSGSQAELREPAVAMLRERRKQKTCKADNIDVLHRGGQTRSSEETAVMAVERRGLVTRPQPTINQKWEE